MEKENNVLISFGKLGDTLSEEVFQIKRMSLYEIKQACEDYDPNVDYSQILANLLVLNSTTKQKLPKEEDSADFVAFRQKSAIKSE